MIRQRLPALSKLALCILLASLAACGGGETSQTEANAEQTVVANAEPAALAMQAPGPSMTAQAITQTAGFTLRARGTLASNVGPIVQLRVNGIAAGSVEVRASSMTDYTIPIASIPKGAKVELVYNNDAAINGQDRNLFISYVSFGGVSVLPMSTPVVFDRGINAAAFDNLDVLPGTGDIYWSGALRFNWPGPVVVDAARSRRYDGARFLMQATFGPTPAEIERVAGMTYTQWIDSQIAKPFAPRFVPYIEQKYALGDDHRPQGPKYNPAWITQRFWANAATADDQLRQRVAFALHEILMVSQTDSNLWHQARAYGNYLDTLSQHALGNYRTLLQEVALNPTTGIYLSHMRNRKEDPATGRLPDENFAREVMQLFSIGLHELNPDGTQKLDANGKPIETYGNQDVMAMAKAFTGFSWAFPDDQLNENTFRWSNPDLSTAAKDQRIDLKKMRAYPGMWSTAEKRIFAGKPWAVTIPAGTNADDSLRMALDAVFNHPNVGPFISKQLIQRLVTSNPSPAYVGRVAAVFNNNGRGVRGDMAAVVKALLLDTEARTVNANKILKMREPVLRISHWMRAMQAKSVTGEYMMPSDGDTLQQRPMYAPSVFSYFRPGYVAPNTRMAAAGVVTPEFQIVSESTTAASANLAESMAGSGLGWTGTARDVAATLTSQINIATSSQVGDLIENLNLLLFAGAMSAELKSNIVEALAGVAGNSTSSNENRVRLALQICLASPEYLIQR